MRASESPTAKCKGFSCLFFQEPILCHQPGKFDIFQTVMACSHERFQGLLSASSMLREFRLPLSNNQWKGTPPPHPPRPSVPAHVPLLFISSKSEYGESNDPPPPPRVCCVPAGVGSDERRHTRLASNITASYNKHFHKVPVPRGIAD